MGLFYGELSACLCGNHWAVYEIFPGDKHFGQSLSAGGAIDSHGNLFFSWNSFDEAHSKKGNGPVTLWVSKSTDHGKHWTRPVFGESGAPPPCRPCGFAYLSAQDAIKIGSDDSFPALTVGKDAGDVRLGWMDTRTGAWNVFFLSSTDGGVHLIPTIRVSGYVPGYTYLTKAGFTLPYGDYFQMTVDEDNNTQMAFGE